MNNFREAIQSLKNMLHCPDEYKNDFITELKSINLFRIKWFSRVLVAFSSFLIIYLIIHLKVFGFLPTPHVVIFHLINIFFCLFINICIWFFESHPDWVKRFGEAFNIMFLGFIGLWTAVISLYAQRSHGQISTYLFGIIGIAIATYTRPKFTAIIYVLLNTFFIFFLPYFQPSQTTRSSEIINTFYFICISSVIGAIFYNMRINDFIQKSIIKNQVMQMEKMNQDLQDLSIRDALTSIRNRRCFDEFISLEWNRSVRERAKLSIAIIDIDHFKNYNDHYGHLQGDSCLKQVTEIIVANLRRPGDMVFRFGGEEFALILPNTDFEGGKFVCEVIRSKVEEANIPQINAATGRVTISIGVATIIPEPEDVSNDFLNRVDQLLYDAKQNGRNQVKFET